MVAVADGILAILGSANLTAPGLESNLEAGVLLTAPHAESLHQILMQTLTSSLVQHIFTTSDYQV